MKEKAEIFITENIFVLEHLLILLSLSLIFITCPWDKILTYVFSVLEHFNYAYRDKVP